MIRSMTGYGRAENTAGPLDISLEVKSVNHRYFEFSARVPRAYAFLEERLKSFFQTRVSRGKLDVYVTINTAESAGTKVEINRPLAEGYIAALRSLAEEYHLPDDLSVSSVARFGDIFTVQKEALDEDVVWEEVSAAAEAALDHFIAMREAEGARLVADIESRAAVILEQVAFVESRSPETVRQYREKIEQKIRELIGDLQVDEQRLLTETAIFADKVAVAEETVRLRSHMEQLHMLLESGQPVGRRLDFIVQEMNREANTIGSKAQDVEIARAVVEIKAEIEKIREQIQNIE